MKQWGELASDEAIERTIAALKANGIEAMVVGNGGEAKRKVMELIPVGAEVMTMSSATLETIGVTEEINREGGKFKSIRHKLAGMKRETQGREMNQLGAVPQVAVGSVHAVTEDGRVLVASNTGSQLPAYVYGAEKVIWVVGVQKIVANTDEGVKRIYEYVLPLEDVRAKKVYGGGSNVSKLLMINKEIRSGRLMMVMVKEKLGF